MENNMHLKTDRLYIRPFLCDDIEDTYEIYSNKDVCKYLLEDVWVYENKIEEFRIINWKIIPI